MYDGEGINVIESNSKRLKLKTKAVAAGDVVTMSWSFDNILRSGTYTVSVACCDQSALHYYDWQNHALRFDVVKPVATAGIVDPVIVATERTDA
jgi:hypothetical protein